MSADIFASQPGDEDLLAEIFDLEHDGVVEDLPFWREQVRLGGGRVLDLGCGSGRLFGALLEGGATRLVGIDGSAAPFGTAVKPVINNSPFGRRVESLQIGIEDSFQCRFGFLRGDWREVTGSHFLFAEGLGP